VEIEGVVDLAVECVSDSSEDKDLDRLPELYHRAGIPEYWIVDVRGDPVDLQVLVHAPDGYTRAPVDRDGFARSPLLGQRVRVVRERKAAGLVFFRLERRG
jgi:Uma2 family endonuclease